MTEPAKSCGHDDRHECAVCRACGCSVDIMTVSDVIEIDWENQSWATESCTGQYVCIDCVKLHGLTIEQATNPDFLRELAAAQRGQS